MSNQLPEGYKQTEIGVIPEDWEVKQLGDVCEIISGGTPSTSNINFWNGKISWCTPTDITATPGKYLERTARKISEEGLRDSAANLLPVGSILLCTRATIGEIKIARFPVATNQGFKSLIPQEGIDNEFIYYLMLSQKNKLIEKGVGSTFLEISKKDVASLKFNLPCFKEQRSLSQALSDVDALIAALDKLIAKNRDLKTATMQQLLMGQKRLPGFGEEQGYKESEIGLIPEDWDVSAVGNICDFIVPGRNKPKIFKGNIPWVTTPDLEDGQSVFTSKLGLFISRDEAKIVGSKIVPSGAVIMSCVGELGIVAFVEREIVINQQLHAFIPSPVIDSIFLLNALQAQKDFMFSIATQTAVPYLNKDNCNSIPIPLPAIFEQRAIALVLSDMDNAISALESRLAKTKAIKQGMMQELLTGRTRLI